MMHKIDLKLWWVGVLMLIGLIALGVLVLGDGKFSLPDHQSAGSAARVDEIQEEWKAKGSFIPHLVGMFADLVFILVYCLGAWRAGNRA